jgi:hypothetical protein
MEKDGKTIHINQLGIRDDSDTVSSRRKVVLLGDSVPFSIGLSQEETSASRLQGLVGDSADILNFGMPGYGLEEIARFLEIKYPAYKPDQIYYLLNLNDFSRRNTLYEGADNGLYRMYYRPFLKMPFFMGKVIYRYMKRGKLSSVRWYRWLYEGNKEKGLAIVKQMADFAKMNDSQLSVVLFPPAVGYEKGVFQLQDVFDEICACLKENSIPCSAPVEEFSHNLHELQDNSDHLTAEGCKTIAAVFHRMMNGGH